MALVGLEKLYYALITSDTSSELAFNTPVYLAGVKELGISPKQNTEKLFAENKLWDQDTVLEEVEVTINIADLTNTQLVALLGHTLASEGGAYAKSSDEAPYVALLYKANKSNGESRYGVLYKGKFTLPEDSAKGQEGKVEYQTPSIKATFQPLQNNSMWKYQVDTDDPNCPVDIDTTWFTAVTVPGSDTVAPTVTTVPLDGAVGVAVDADVVFTFSKAILASTMTAGNIFLMKADGTAVAASLSLGTNNTVVTLNPTEDLTAGDYVAVCTTNVKSTAGVPLAANCIVNFTV